MKRSAAKERMKMITKKVRERDLGGENEKKIKMWQKLQKNDKINLFDGANWRKGTNSEDKNEKQKTSKQRQEKLNKR